LRAVCATRKIKIATTKKLPQKSTPERVVNEEKKKINNQTLYKEEVDAIVRCGG
jgi:hypothetical protein